VNLNDLPQFEISSFFPETKYGGAGFSGRFSGLEGVREGVCWLRISKQKSARGKLHALDAASGAAIFVPWEGREHLAVGMELPWIDGFWRAVDIEMVIDPAWSWTKLRFEPRDAWMTADIKRRMLRPAPAGVNLVPSGATLVPKGWDHEHCRFCWEKIGAGGVATGFVDDAGTWLCESCYSQFVVTHDLSFIEIFGKIWPASSSTP
jgi:hypothetical protein